LALRFHLSCVGFECLLPGPPGPARVTPVRESVRRQQECGVGGCPALLETPTWGPIHQEAGQAGPGMGAGNTSWTPRLTWLDWEMARPRPGATPCRVEMMQQRAAIKTCKGIIEHSHRVILTQPRIWARLATPKRAQNRGSAQPLGAFQSGARATSSAGIGVLGMTVDQAPGGGAEKACGLCGPAHNHGRGVMRWARGGGAHDAPLGSCNLAHLRP
jgi:hypothetical protein